MTSSDMNITSIEHLDALRSKGEISEDDYRTLREALESSAPRHEPAVNPPKRLCKSWKNRQINGVCGGIAEHFGVEARLVRLLFVIGLFISGGTLLFVYLVLSLALPWDEDARVSTFSYAAKLVVYGLVLNLAFYASLSIAYRTSGMTGALSSIPSAFTSYNQGHFVGLWAQAAVAAVLVAAYRLAPLRARKRIARGTLWGFFLTLIAVLAISLM